MIDIGFSYGGHSKKCKAGGDDRLYKGSYIDQRNYCIARLLETYSEHSWLTLFPPGKDTFYCPDSISHGKARREWS